MEIATCWFGRTEHWTEEYIATPAAQHTRGTELDTVCAAVAYELAIDRWRKPERSVRMCEGKQDRVNRQAHRKHRKAIHTLSQQNG